ncbi:hypothetical protein MPTK1_1g17040 [Marchantia polymorpha subsp. ruderalis]|uniref:Uncharacterized protein n=2 Tax=Marchantia polymorpha TaxID=3197 RepID=A0AAF6AR30_MARPO|nr:hypothetical protein MARPO_0001s0044 [Marchantia polymorpha]BBM98900.1 hypothetical protein Mp_1g17040 [Marchantia polymorpha subsp. ruderalis]|eukprot:PTQ49976.1 hypothetical protein MARPO_0001s0044 [Marchantia polymorpha]
MFTDGLDHDALRWIKKEEHVVLSNSSTPGTLSPSFASREPPVCTGRSRNSNWGLPPSQLANVHLHSGLLRGAYSNHTPSTNEDLEESVGSISGGVNDDSFDTDDSDDSVESSVAHSPRRNGVNAILHESSHDTNEAHHRKADTASKRSDDSFDHNYVPSGKKASHEGLARKVPESGRGQGGHEADSTGFYDIDLPTPDSKADSNRLSDLSKTQKTSRIVINDKGEAEFQDFHPESDELTPSAQESLHKMLDDRGTQNNRFMRNMDRRGLHSTRYSSETEYSDEENVDDDSQRSPTEACKRSNYPTIDIEDLCYPQKVHTEPNELGVGTRDVRVSQDYSEATLAGDGLRRSRSDSVGLPPSAPPMLASMVMEPQPEIVVPIPAFSVSKSSVTAFSFDTENKHSGPLRQAEPSFRSVSGLGHGPGVTLDEGRAHTRQTSQSQAPPLYLSGQSAWQALIAYDACVRLCLGAWARGCAEAPEFLQDECTLLRHSFGLQQLLLQPYEELKRKGVADETEGTAASKPKRNIGKLRVQVRKLKISKSQLPTGFTCPSFGSIKFESLYASVDDRSSNQRARLLPGWAAVRKLRVLHRALLRGNASQRSLAYVNAGAQYMRQVSGILKDKVNSLRSNSLNSLEGPQEGFSCVLKLKSSTEDEAVRMVPGAGDATVFLPESPADELIIDVQDLKGSSQGRCVVQLTSISDDPTDRVRWFSVYLEPEHECIGKVQLSISYNSTSSEIGASKWGAVGETLAYDIVLEVAMRAERFQRRNLRIQGSWQWLLSEFAVYYGVSDAYTKLRYLASVMEVATPTEDCLMLIYDLLCPIVKIRDEGTLDRQEKRILADVEEQVSQLLALVFENYKSLDETSSTGMTDVFPAVGAAAPALVPAVQIYTLLHDILTLDAQTTLRNYFKAAAKKRCKRHMGETDEFVSSSSEGFLMDPMTLSAAYQKMKTLCVNISNEVRTDIDIHNQHVLPSSIDLPNIVANIYSVELSSRLRSFLVACPPPGPAPPVAELMLATDDFQRDLSTWGIRPVKFGVDAKELFHLYIVLWVQDKRLHLLDFCKLDKDRYTWVTTQNVTVPFVEEMYERIKDTLNEYEIIINRWPEYTISLETAVADVERAIISAIEKQYSDVLTPLKDVMIPKKFSLQYMQKLTRRRSICLYSVPSQLGVMLNSIKRLLDTLRPKVELQMKGWVSCLPVEGGGPGKSAFGERLNEVTIELRAKYKNYLHAIVEKLADNTRLQRATKLKKILQDTREAGGESDIRDRMQPLTFQLVETISHLHEVFSSRVFVAVCRGYWDRMARDVLHFLENRKENRAWYKGSSFALGILDDIFASQMQRLQGHGLQEKDLDPPRSVMEARSMLSRDAQNGLDSSTLFFY